MKTISFLMVNIQGKYPIRLAGRRPKTALFALFLDVKIDIGICDKVTNNILNMLKSNIIITL